MMIKFIKNIFVFGLMGIVCQINAQSKLAGGFEHVIDVCRYTDWGKDYLTITDDKQIGLKATVDEKYKYYHVTYDYVDECKTDKNKHFCRGCLILAVDGVSAKGWTAEQFYQKTDNRHDVIKLMIREKSETGIIEYETKIQPMYELPDDIKIFGNSFANIQCTTLDSHRRRSGINLVFDERIDEDFDFFPCLTYDYHIDSSDPLLDKEILKNIVIESMKRDENNPDIVFTIARDAKESINTTYIPPTSRTVDLGSTTTSSYNKKTGRTTYYTTHNQYVKRTPGYTKTTTSLSTYLEIAALNAKKLNDANTTHAPVVWQVTAKRNITNPNFKISDELIAYATWMRFPIRDRIHWQIDGILYAPVGVVCSPQNPSVIQEVVKGSRAEQIGLMPGDKIVKVNTAKKYRTINGEEHIFASGLGARKAKCAMAEPMMTQGLEAGEKWLSYTIEVLRDGKKLKFELHPYGQYVHRYYAGKRLSN